MKPPRTLSAARWTRSGTKQSTSWHIGLGASPSATQALCHTAIPDTAQRREVDLATMRLSGCGKCYKILLTNGVGRG